MHYKEQDLSPILFYYIKKEGVQAMIRGTTPTHTFDLPISKGNIKDIRITYVQNDEKIIEKKITDVILSEKKVAITLTQDESLKFKARRTAFVQIRILTDENKVFTSNSEGFFVYDTFNEEILS